MAKKNVTMSDIAKDLGISTVSVSKAISGKDGVSASVRDKILKRAEEMGYVYGKVETEERLQNKIGIIVGEHFISKDAYYSGMYQKTMMMLAENGQMGLLEIIKKESENANEPPALLVSRQIDGLIVLGQMPRLYLKMLKTYRIPVLYMDFYDEGTQEDAVVSDSVYGSGILTNYLIGRGHQKIAFVGSIRSTSSIMDRYIGYYKAMLYASFPVEEDWIIEDRDEDGHHIDINLPKHMPTAFVCNSDAVAFKLVNKLKENGYAVPADVSVVGFDNFIYSELSSPRITTYGVDVDSMVRSVVRIMIHKIEDPTFTVGRVVVAGTMVERDSVKGI